MSRKAVRYSLFVAIGITWYGGIIMLLRGDWVSVFGLGAALLLARLERIIFPDYDDDPGRE